MCGEKATCDESSILLGDCPFTLGLCSELKKKIHGFCPTAQLTQVQGWPVFQDDTLLPFLLLKCAFIYRNMVIKKYIYWIKHKVGSPVLVFQTKTKTTHKSRSPALGAPQMQKTRLLSSGSL
jgi:hypothetical protein